MLLDMNAERVMVCMLDSAGATNGERVVSLPGLAAGAILSGGARLALDVAPEVTVSLRLGNGLGSSLVGQIPAGAQPFGNLFRPGPTRAHAALCGSQEDFSEALAVLAGPQSAAASVFNDAPMVFGRPSMFAGKATSFGTFGRSTSEAERKHENRTHAAWAGADALVSKSCVMPFHAAAAEVI